MALSRALLPVLAAATFVVASSSSCEGCGAPKAVLSAHGLEAETTEVRVVMLGRLDDAGLAAAKARPDVDGILRLPSGSCDGEPEGRCQVAEVSVYVKNRGSEGLPPPVVRTRTPTGRPERVPLSLRAQEVSPGRTGRIRWLVELWPEEAELDVSITGSVWLVFDDGPAVEPAIELGHAPAANEDQASNEKTNNRSEVGPAPSSTSPRPEE